MTQTAGFSCRKWTIIGLCSLLLIVKAIAICVFVADFDSNIDKINQDKKPWEKLTKFHAIVSVVLPNVVYVIVSLIGICGAIKESFCLSTTFCVLFVYPAIKMIIDLSNDSKYWYEFIVIAVLAAAEIYFVIDLFKDRSKLTKIYLDIIATKTTAFIVLIIFNTISISITLIGLFGAIFEHYCSSIIFTILYSFTLVGVICELFKNSNYIYEFFLVFLLWTLVAIFSVVILEKIITLISFLAKKNDYVKEIQLNEDVTLSKTQALIIVVISELITIAILIMGLIGALRQKFCLSLTFCIFFGLSMIKSVVDLSVGDQNIFIFIGLLIFFILDALFVYELRKLRSKQIN
ncbi:hypothetical protein DERP_009515 [Dermatophagoides pteronyssinus]|uniref:Uncharacterized protein n=1 Tax=Dermatophagoides pteronyssinus TaxID=6956 RepID=A0ABQ8IUC4_DERPT|nr:hypothetical protein DERP_009515 [Dermatophagoides pteronyssinus]